jgi:hypothetical protein
VSKIQPIASPNVLGIRSRLPVMAIALLLLAWQPISLGPFHLAVTPLGPGIASAGAYQGLGGRVISLAAAADGRRFYAGTWGAGLWRSDDGGRNWRQIVSQQPGDTPLLACSGVRTHGCLRSNVPLSHISTRCPM